MILTFVGGIDLGWRGMGVVGGIKTPFDRVEGRGEEGCYGRAVISRYCSQIFPSFHALQSIELKLIIYKLLLRIF